MSSINESITNTTTSYPFPESENQFSKIVDDSLQSFIETIRYNRISENDEDIWKYDRDLKVRIKPYSFANPPSSRKSFYTKTQKWVGYVTEIKRESFNAKLTDLTTKGTNENTEFDFDEITDEDKKLIQVGSAFYWSIGYLHSENGQITKESLIRFQRAVEFTNEDNDEALERAQSLIRSLKWEK